jgi:hypothetical protein
MWILQLWLYQGKKLKNSLVFTLEFSRQSQVTDFIGEKSLYSEDADGCFRTVVPMSQRTRILFGPEVRGFKKHFRGARV